MAKNNIPTKVINYEGHSLQFRVPATYVVMEGRKPVLMTAQELLKKENAEILEHLLEGAIASSREVSIGKYKKNSAGKVLDTDGKLHSETWKEGGTIAHMTEVHYGAIFKAAVKDAPTTSATDEYPGAEEDTGSAADTGDAAKKDTGKKGN